MRPTAQPETPKSPFSSASDGLGICIGIAAAFLVAPQLYSLGTDWVGGYTAAEYGAQFVDPVRLLFLLLLAFLVFNLTRLICSATISGIGLWIGTSLLSRFR